ncbi:MAG: alpha/beta hydrolase [Acidobacteriota bacterium]|nr:alpha/beta hydrolase [Acidobacteriota bacterium]
MPMPAVDPQFQLAIEAVRPTMPLLHAGMLEELREVRRANLERQQLSDRVERRDYVVPGPPNAPEITVRLHVPVGLHTPAPCLYSMHGGGYVLGHRAIDDVRFDRWCPELGFIGASVEYRLAPETPFPGPLEDCYAGLTWLFAHASELGIDPTRIGVGGASAGGGLAAALALLARDRGQLDVAFQLLAYPMIDDTMGAESNRWNVPIWPAANNAFGWRSYLGDLHGRDDVPYLAAPARATDVTGLPPTLVFVGTVDGLCDESVAYASRLYRAGIATELHVYPGAPHAFDSIAPDAPMSVRGTEAVKSWLRAAFTVA